MVLFYTIIFSYWSSEFYQCYIDFLYMWWLYWVISLGSVFVEISILRSGYKICASCNFKRLFFHFFLYILVLVQLNSIWWAPRMRFFIVITSKEWQKTVFFIFIAICPGFYFITPISTITMRVITWPKGAQEIVNCILYQYF